MLNLTFLAKPTKLRIRGLVIGATQRENLEMLPTKRDLQVFARSVVVVAGFLTPRAFAEDPICGLAREIGCGPTALAVAGFSPAEAAAALSRLASHEEEVAGLASAESQVASALALCSALQRQWDEDPLDETADAITSARAGLATAQQAVAEKRAALVDVVLLEAESGTTARLRAVHRSPLVRCPLAVLACSAPEDVPFLSVVFTKAQRNVAGEMTTAESSAMSEWLSRSDVIGAQHDLDTNESAIEQVFTAFGT